MLNKGKEKFEGGLNTKKYMAISKISRAIAIRDIGEWLEYGCIVQKKGAAGRNVRYELLLE